MSLKHYTFIMGDVIRFVLIFVPALVLLISFGMVNALEKVRKGSRLFRGAVIVIIASMVLFMFVTSLALIRYDLYSERNWVEPLVQIAGFVGTLPANATVYRPLSVPIDPYTGYRNFAMLNSPLQNCSQLETHSYLIMLENYTYARACDLTLVFRPEMPAWLAEYNLFTQISAFGINYGIVVYYKND
jgi:hypothetical protein